MANLTNLLWLFFLFSLFAPFFQQKMLNLARLSIPSLVNTRLPRRTSPG